MPFGASALGCYLVPEGVGHSGPEFTVDICGVTAPVGSTQPSLRADLKRGRSCLLGPCLLCLGVSLLLASAGIETFLLSELGAHSGEWSVKRADWVLPPQVLCVKRFYPGAGTPSPPDPSPGNLTQWALSSVLFSG